MLSPSYRTTYNFKTKQYMKMELPQSFRLPLRGFQDYLYFIIERGHTKERLNSVHNEVVERGQRE